MAFFLAGNVGKFMAAEAAKQPAADKEAKAKPPTAAEKAAQEKEKAAAEAKAAAQPKAAAAKKAAAEKAAPAADPKAAAAAQKAAAAAKAAAEKATKEKAAADAKAAADRAAAEKAAAAQAAVEKAAADEAAAAARRRRTGKMRVYVAVPGEAKQPAALRSELLEVLRENSSKLRAHCRRNRLDRFTCGYTGKPLAFEDAEVRPGVPKADVEHVIEGQMDGHVLAYCTNKELRDRLKQADLHLPGVVRSSVFAPHFRIHNGDDNLTFADHALNTRKKAQISKALQHLDSGEALSRTLRDELALKLGDSPHDAAGSAAGDAARLAASVCARMRDVEAIYCSALESVGLDDPSFSVVDRNRRPAVVSMYAAIAEDMGQLYEALGL
jgi:chemotaxis protein histidine kinase CheA